MENEILYSAKTESPLKFERVWHYRFSEGGCLPHAVAIYTAGELCNDARIFRLARTYTKATRYPGKRMPPMSAIGTPEEWLATLGFKNIELDPPLPLSVAHRRYGDIIAGFTPLPEKKKKNGRIVGHAAAILKGTLWDSWDSRNMCGGGEHLTSSIWHNARPFLFAPVGIGYPRFDESRRGAQSAVARRAAKFYNPR